MIEESFIRLYAHDFVQFAGRSELGQDVAQGVDKRMADARSHAALMDARKGSDHLAALVTRLYEEAAQFNSRVMLRGTDPAEAAARHRLFLLAIADKLSRPAEAGPAPRTMSAVTRLTRRAAQPTLAVETTL